MGAASASPWIQERREWIYYGCAMWKERSIRRCRCFYALLSQSEWPSQSSDSSWPIRVSCYLRCYQSLLYIPCPLINSQLPQSKPWVWSCFSQVCWINNQLYMSWINGHTYTFLFCPLHHQLYYYTSHLSFSHTAWKSHKHVLQLNSLQTHCDSCCIDTLITVNYKFAVKGSITDILIS